MQTIIICCLINFLIVVSANPIHEDGLVEVSSDNDGHYKYIFTSINITIAEERNKEGTVTGTYSYIDDFGNRQTVNYVAGTNGFKPTGTTIPVNGPSPVAELPDVQEARLLHEKVTEEITQLLPKLKLGEDVVEEQPIVPLIKEEHLAAIKNVLEPKYLVFAEETPEIKKAKEELYQAYAKILV